MSIFYENQRNVILQNDSSYVGFFFLIWLQFIHGIFI